MKLRFRGQRGEGHADALTHFDRRQGADAPPTRKRSDGSLALALLGLLYAIYLASFSGVYHSSDEMSMLVATDSLARRGAWDIELLRWMGEQQGSFGPDGQLYSRKGIGMTLAALPIYWLALQVQAVGNVQAGMLTNAGVTALTGMLIFLSLRRLRFGQGTSLLTALAFGLGTMAWPYARYFFSESLCGLGLMLSLYALLRFRDNPGSLSPLLAGAGLGVALLARLNNALAAPFLGLLLLAYLARRHGRHWQAYVVPVLLFGLPIFAALGVSGGYNWIRFGNPLTTGYLPEERFSAPLFEGLYGLTLSWGKGLLWYNPLLMVAVAAWPAFYRRHRAEALLVAAIVLSTLLFYAPWYLWWAGHGWGPRFLVSLLPLAALPLAVPIELAARHRALALALVVVAAASLAVQVLGVAVDFNLYLEDVYAELGLYHPATLFEPAYSPLVRQWAYLSSGPLDMAWVRLDDPWLGLLCVLLPVVVALAALWSAWWRETPAWASGGGLFVLAAYTALLLVNLEPDGDVAEIVAEMRAMERPGEVVVVANPLLTEAFQNAYDGRLPAWGVSDRTLVPGAADGTWFVDTRAPDEPPLRFQMGELTLAYYPMGGSALDAGGQPAPPEPPGPDLVLGNVTQLANVEIGEEVEPGDKLAVTLWWRTLAPFDTSYTVFVHVLDGNGTKAGQVDRLPCGGACPTTSWRQDDLVGERFEIGIDEVAPGGPYQVIAGMYDLDTGLRLPAFDAAGHPAGDYVSVGTVTVR
jgi:hypothetical protein